MLSKERMQPICIKFCLWPRDSGAGAYFWSCFDALLLATFFFSPLRGRGVLNQSFKWTNLRVSWFALRLHALISPVRDVSNTTLDSRFMQVRSVIKFLGHSAMVLMHHTEANCCSSKGYALCLDSGSALLLSVLKKKKTKPSPKKRSIDWPLNQMLLQLKRARYKVTLKLN